MFMAETLPLPKRTELSYTETFHYSKKCLLGEACRAASIEKRFCLSDGMDQN